MKKAIIILLLLTSCFKKEPSALPVNHYPDSDTLSVSYYEDKTIKEIKFTDYKTRVFYKNGNLFSEGYTDEHNNKIGEWLYYTKEGLLSEMREFKKIQGDARLNRFLYFRGDPEEWYYVKDYDFNVL